MTSLSENTFSGSGLQLPWKGQTLYLQHCEELILLCHDITVYASDYCYWWFASVHCTNAKYPLYKCLNRSIHKLNYLCWKTLGFDPTIDKVCSLGWVWIKPVMGQWLDLTNDKCLFDDTEITQPSGVPGVWRTGCSAAFGFQIFLTVGCRPFLDFHLPG